MAVEPVDMASMTPQPDVVATLEDLLARARAGEVRGVAVACSLTGRERATAYALGDGDYAHLVAGVAWLQHRLITEDENE